MKRLTIVIVMLLSFAGVQAQDKYVSFKQEKITFTPKSFYISDVMDDRADKTADGIIKNNDGSAGKVMFTNGFAASLKTFIDKNVVQKKTTQAIVLHILNLDAQIKKTGGLWRADVSLAMAFYAAGKKVVEYTGKGSLETNGSPAGYIEKFTRQTLEKELRKFDNWWQNNKENTATDPNVKVNVAIAETTDMPGCFVYSRQRPLQIIDFTGPPKGSDTELAATLSGIGVFYSARTRNGQLVLDITVTPYFDKNNSFFKEAGKNPRVLAHEQAHFDITAIKACELVALIRKTTYTQDNYKDLIEAQRKQNIRELNDEQEAYDKETNHGRVEDKQIMWQARVAEKVSSIGCY